MAPGKDTEPFFLDEATALAAGHRPCNDCRSERLNEFKAAWAEGVDGGHPGGRTLVSRIDPVMKRDRWEGPGVQRRFDSRLVDLPDGVMLMLPASGARRGSSGAIDSCAGRRRGTLRRDQRIRTQWFRC